jgi:hypothetical protein
MKKLFLLLAISIISINAYSQEEEEKKQENAKSLETEKKEGVYESDFNFYGIEVGNLNKDMVIKVKSYKRKQKRNYFVFDFEFGLDGFQENYEVKNANIAYPEFDTWKSMYIAFSFNNQRRLFSENSPVFLKYGLGLQWDNFRVKGDYVLQKSQNGIEYISDPISRNLNKSKIKNLNMIVPVMLQFDNSKNGIDKGFKFGIGAYGGVRWYTWQKLEFKDSDGDHSKVTERNKYHVNPFIYGLQSELGYGSMSITAKYDLSPFFEVKNDYDYQAWRLGIKFAL